MRLAICALLLSACFQPVGEASGPRVTLCRGACPSGECRECAPVDPGCHTPTCELERYSCSRSTPCDAYDDVEKLPKSGGAYCFTLDHDGGTWAVDRTGATIACAPNPPRCDGGTAQDAGACGPCVRKTYCIGG